MSTVNKSWRLCLLTFLLAMILPFAAVADEKYDLLRQQVDTLQKQLEQVQVVLKKYEQQSASNQ